MDPSLETAINLTLATYIWAADAGRMADVLALFSPDAVYRNQGGAYDGLEHQGQIAIGRYLNSVVADFQAVAAPVPHRHHLSSIRVERTDADTARSASYFLAIGADGPDHWGTYRDTLVAVHDRWLFQERTCRVEGMAPTSWQRRVLARGGRSAG